MIDMRRNALRLLRPTRLLTRHVDLLREFRRVGSLLPTRSTRAPQSKSATSCPPYLATGLVKAGIYPLDWAGGVAEALGYDD